MKSHPCVKTTGGVLLAADSPSHHAKTLIPCRYINRRGHHCRLFSSLPNLELCPHHARQLQKQKQRVNDATAAELLGDLTDFSTPDAVNILLGNLVRQLARKRIQRRDAMAIAYVSQLLLTSHAALDRREARDQPIGPFVFTPHELTSAPSPDSTEDPTEASAADSTIATAPPFSVALYHAPQNHAAQNQEGRA